MESLHIELGTSWWWYAGVLVALGAASVWYYAAHRSALHRSQRAVLAVLRWLGLALLVSALFVPGGADCLLADRSAPGRCCCG